jgi:nucleoside-diphosphate kinase
MAIEQTFAVIKPDAVKAGISGKVIDMIESNGFEILRMQKGQLSPELAEIFYDVHKEKPFFNELVQFIASGPIIIMALQKDNAISEWRKLMGATDPAKAEAGTIRNKFGTSIGNNVVHGSDSSETAMRELGLFFAEPAPAKR